MNKKPRIIRMFQNVRFTLNKAYIDVDFNYETKKYYMSHGHNDMNVTFNAERGNSATMQEHLDRAQCVIAALNYIKCELNL